MVKRSLPVPVTIAAILFLGTTLVQAYEVRINEVINKPTVIYKQAFSVDVTLGIWNSVLDNPCLMGQLWEIYKFQPHYKVTTDDADIHVSDPSGITGDIRQIGQSDHARIFYGTGQFNHWAVPSFFTANGVVIFEYNTQRNGLSGEVNIFMRGDNGISRFIMRIFSGILTRRIDNRFTNNLKDMKKIIRDIAHDPHKVRDTLAGRLLNDFNSVFPVMETKPAED